MKKRESGTTSSSDDDEGLPDYSQWSFERPSGKLDAEIGKVLNNNREQAFTTSDEEEEDLPDYSNWKSATLESSIDNNNNRKQILKEKSPLFADDSDEDASVTSKKLIINDDEKTDEKEDDLSQKLQQSLSKIKKTMNEDDEFSFIPKQKKKSTADSASKKKSLDVKKNKFDFSDILFDLDSEEESSDEEPLSYDAWKQKQEIKLKNKSPLDMLESLKKMSDTISPIDKPLNPQMTDLEHKLMLEWMFPLCKFKQK